jgi:hypothetical protein
MVQLARLYADGLATDAELCDAAEAANAWAWELEGPPDGPGPDLLAYSLLGKANIAAVIRRFINDLCNLGHHAPMLIMLLSQTKHFPEIQRECCDILREMIGNPFRNRQITQEWLQSDGRTVSAIAATIYEEERFTEMPILADALEEVGFDQEDLIIHCRTSNTASRTLRKRDPCVRHQRGCWALDALLGRGIITV